MKKNLFGCTVAICAAVGLFSYKATNRGNNQTLYYFRTAVGHGCDAQYINSGLSTRYGTNVPIDDCDGSGARCIIGFTANQLNANQTKIKTNVFHQTLPQTCKLTLYTHTGC